MSDAFDITEYPLPFGTIVEASAGTGKTFSVAAYVTLAIATDEGLRIGNILVTTYTRNAAAELRDRIRGRLITTARILRATDSEGRDPLDKLLLAGDRTAQLARARRLERAVAEFDTATIGTIHSICARVLRMAGIEPGETGDDDRLTRSVAEAVNDAVVAEAAAGRSWEERRLIDLVTAAVRDPFIEPWFDAAGRSEADLDLLTRLVALVRQCVSRVQMAMRATPSFDDLLRLAWEEVRKPARAGLVTELRRRFRLAIVDEAQDTSRLQWEFFHELFPAGASGNDDPRRLIAVGDPKQAIYGFRGADVTAYLRFSQGDGNGSRPRRTLATNYRSDGPLLQDLNAAMVGAEFGPGIDYQPVQPSPDRRGSRLVDLPPVEFIGLGEAWATDVAARKVYELLTQGRLDFSQPGESQSETKHPRPIRPGEICVLVRINSIGKAIEDRLARVGIPAVSTGTASVMDGQMADDLRVLLEAMERPGSSSRVRRAAATVFFGHLLTEVGRLGEETEQAVQEQIAGLHGILQAEGIAAVAAAIMGDVTMAGRLAAGDEGERQVVDLTHLVELLHDASHGRGCHARVMLDHVSDLAARDEKLDLVSRRVESDEDAVRIMSVHVAKGLEFPCVVVVDDWKEKDRSHGPAVFYAGHERRLDVCYALAAGSSAATAAAVVAADNEELRRLLYVAVTRPRHHLCVIRPTDGRDTVLQAVMQNPPPERDARDLPPLSGRWRPMADGGGGLPDIAPLHARVDRTFRRTSFSGITAEAARVTGDPHAPVGRGHDEERPGVDDPDAGEQATVEATDVPRDLAPFTIADLPAGTAFGSVVHEIFERLACDPAADAPARAAAVAHVVRDVATSNILRPHLGPLAEMITTASETPFGGPAEAAFRDLRFTDFAPTDRLAELDFEMGLADLAAGVRASDVGRVLATHLSESEPLAAYARVLSGPAFHIPLAGLINGSIDAVLRLPGRPIDDTLVIVADYKTNKLHRHEDRVPLAAYAPANLVATMAEHHYPLQALLYGTAIYRLLRWRLGPLKPAGWDPGACIAGVVYGFIRGMQGPDTPVDERGHRFGVFSWIPPSAIWRDLSELFAGQREAARK